jgi:hypothetical protein
LFLRAGAVLDSGWVEETTRFIQSVAGSDRERAGIFRCARAPYAETGLRDRLASLARIVAGARADQALLIARDHYERLGGYAADGRGAEAKLRRQLRACRVVLRSRIVMVEAQ